MARVSFSTLVVLGVAVGVPWGLAVMTGWDVLALPILFFGAMLVAIVLWSPSSWRPPIGIAVGGIATACALLMILGFFPGVSGLVGGWFLYFGVGAPAAALALMWRNVGPPARSKAVAAAAAVALVVLVASSLYIAWMLAGFS